MPSPISMATLGPPFKTECDSEWNSHSAGRSFSCALAPSRTRGPSAFSLQPSASQYPHPHTPTRLHPSPSDHDSVGHGPSTGNIHGRGAGFQRELGGWAAVQVQGIHAVQAIGICP